LGQGGFDLVAQIDIDSRGGVSFLTHVGGKVTGGAMGDKPRLSALTAWLGFARLAGNNFFLCK
jgi:hypothetical protein